jgi:hypothetical protein
LVRPEALEGRKMWWGKFLFSYKNIKFLFYGAILVALFAAPTIAFCKADSSCIDTAMPASIPSEITTDWKIKDNVDTGYSAAIAEIKSSLPAEYASKIDTGSLEALYFKACHWRRVARIQPFSRELKHLLFARHYNEGGVMTGYLDDMNDDTVMKDTARKITSSKGDRYEAGAAFRILTFDNYYPDPVTLLDDKTGVLRDPCVSFDATRVAFAWSKDNNGYHIYEMEIARPDSIRQLTFDLPGVTVSDYEPCYCPSGDIIFNSSRCIQGQAYASNVVNNLFIMNKDGKYLRRICFDQAHDFHPTLMSDGKIMFSRWEFNDRHPGYVFGVFTMNPDGTLQNEYFGNQLTWPNTFPNAREIPNSQGKFLSIIGYVTGSVYQGDLVKVDPSKGRNAINAIQIIAPKRDIYSDINTKFQDPYPLNETWFLISYAENPSTAAKYRLYLMDIDGNRELLAWDVNQSISQPIPLFEKKTTRIACLADYTKTTGEVTMTNAYYGMGIDATIKRGAIKKIRVIALEYRMYPSIGYASSYTPIARSGGSHESKRIIGEMKVESDGSAAFIVPARTPLYVQLIDSSGCMIQSMRSWMTLQPGEKFDCIGCHEDKNYSLPSGGTVIARTPKALTPFYDVVDGYLHYSTVIQPILDAKCVSCHEAGHSSGLDLSGEKIWTGDLVNDFTTKSAERFWCKSYLNLTDPTKNIVSFIDAYSWAEGQKPDSVGSGHSRLITKLRERSGAMGSIALSEKEMAKFCAWIDLCIPHGGKYSDDMTFADSQFYEQRLLLRKPEEQFEAQNIAAFIGNGGYKSADYSGTFVALNNQGKTQAGPRVASGLKFQVRFSRFSRQLILRLPSAGIVTLIDLQGRKVLQINVSNEEYLKGKVTSCFAPAVRVPAGLYIAKFKGKSGSAERIVPAM